MVDNILAVDPGGDTGLAEFDYITKTWRTTVLPFSPLVLYGFFLAWIQPKRAHKLDMTIICERFDYRPEGKYKFGNSRAIPKVDLTPREVIGILKLACAQHDLDIIWQAPADVNESKKGEASVFWTDAKVKMLGLYKPGHVHEMDAVKHILYYRAFTLDESSLFHALRIPGIFEEVMK